MKTGCPHTHSLADRLRHLAILVIALLASILSVAPVGSASAESPTSAMGVYVGGGNAADFTSFSHWLGKRPAYAMDFLAGGSWNEIDQPAWFLSQWAGTGAEVILSVPMLPSSGGTLAEGATGAYDSYFATLANRLVSAGDQDVILRLGWEMNGNWFAWSIKNGNAANYAAYWRHIVTTMRAISPGFRFDFCVNGGSSTVSGKLLNPAEAYPGDQYVNYIGLDAYDNSWVSGATAFANRWNGWLSQPYGLEWQRQFAAEHGKQVTFPEWGLSDGEHGGGDDPQFIRAMYDWMASSNLGYEAYFEYDEANEAHALANYPEASVVFRELFGGEGSTTSSSTEPATEASTSQEPTKPEASSGPEPASPPPAPESGTTGSGAPESSPKASEESRTQEKAIFVGKREKRSHGKHDRHTAKAHTATMQRPKVWVKRLRTTPGDVRVSLRWSANAGVVIIRNGHVLSRPRRSAHHGATVLRFASTDAGYYSVCEVNRHICSPQRRV